MYREVKVNLECRIYSALARFCFLVDPLSKAYHPTYFRHLLTKRRRNTKGGRRAEGIVLWNTAQSWIEESYQIAIKRHIVEKSTKSVPKRISFSYFPTEEQYVLGWRTRGGTEISLAIDASYPQRYSPLFVIKGWDYFEVTKYEARARSNCFWQTPIPLGDILDFVRIYQQWK